MPASTVAARAAVFLLLALLAEPVDAYGGKDGKKSKFMAAYPMVFKFFLFWWCVVVFAVMGIYIVDHLMFRKFGPAKVRWAVEYTFKGGSSGRRPLWAQLVDPSAWSMAHPILQTADIRMVDCSGAGDAPPATKQASDPDDPGLPESSLKTLDRFKPLAEGLGIMMRHKESTTLNSGSLFCTRECILLSEPEDGPWECSLLTIEVGSGFPYAAGTEKTMIEMHPAAEDGSVLCKMKGQSEVNSRIYRWWSALQPLAKSSATAMMQAIEEEVLSDKKKD